MKTTVAKFSKPASSATIELFDIDASLIRPTARTYGKKDSGGGTGDIKKVANPDAP
jgi:hypothetical protein